MQQQHGKMKLDKSQLSASTGLRPTVAMSLGDATSGQADELVRLGRSAAMENLCSSDCGCLILLSSVFALA